MQATQENAIMLQHIETIWFNEMGQPSPIGIVIAIDNVTGIKKAYIGTGSGRYEDMDTRRIMEGGAKFHYEIAARIADKLADPSLAAARFEMAQQISNAATHMDEIKNHCVLQADVDLAIQHIERLYIIAESLAGDRWAEIHGAENEPRN